MAAAKKVQSQEFKQILRRNLMLPLILSGGLAAVFIAIVLNLLSTTNWVDHSDQVISKSMEGLKLIIDAETGVRGYLVTHNPVFLQPYNEALQQIDPKFDELALFVADNPPQVERIKQIRIKFRTWLDSAMVSKNHPGTLNNEEMLDRKVMMDDIRRDFNAFLASEQQLRADRINSTNQRTYLFLSLTLLISALVGGIVALTARNQLMSLSETYEETLGLQAEQNRILEQQAWLRTGQAELSQKIRAELPIHEISSRMLEYVAEYLGATLGSLYVVEDNGRLKRRAVFAYSNDQENALGTAGENSRKSGQSQNSANSYDSASTSHARSFAFGEGLIGQAAASNRLLKIDQVPQDYVKVVSSLGATAPKQLVVLPLAAEGRVQGVMELGFLNAPVDSYIEFLEKSSDVIGIGLKSALYRVRLQELLNETQSQAEELQTQQEELRVSNEELSERSRLLQDTQSRLECQHAELEQTNEQLEEQKQALDSQNHDLQVARGALEDKAKELEETNRYKSEFLANMSHELRTPLNSSLILAKLLMDNAQGNLTGEQIEFASTIYSAGNDLLALINDILDLSKVEAGKLDLNPEEFSIRQVVQGMEKIFKPLADDKKLALRFEIQDGTPEVINTDRQRLEQILKNLISNAIKFTHKGDVTVTVSRGPQKSVTFAVEDSGEGIAPENHQLVFEAFRQADGSIKRKYGGTGLGLWISRNLAELLGGHIDLDSDVGRGSVFSLTIPQNYVAPSNHDDIHAGGKQNGAAASHSAMRDSKTVKTSKKASSEKSGASANGVSGAVFKSASGSFASASAPDGQKGAARSMNTFDDRATLQGPGGRTLLIVEDEMDFAKILVDLAHELGFKCLVAENTSLAHALALEFLPSAIVLDMKLPDALGLSLLDRLKDNARTRHIPVHIVSGADYSREALHLGAVGYVNKPAARDELRKSLKKLEDKINQQIRRVLVVEDDATQRMAIEKLIGEKGVEITSVGEGQEALEKLRKTNFDCLITDLSLPDMSGFDLLEKLSHETNMAFPPVIVYTGRSLSKQEEERLRKYSRSIIIKGARSPERLLDEVTLFLHQVESQMSPEKQRLLRSSRGREKAFDGRKILVVDDDVRNIFALTAALEQKGARVQVARNGVESLQKLNDNQDVDLVLMDIMMPEMDGYTAIREIRKNDSHAKLPIIAVTAKAMKNDYEKCLKAGANDYLAKPIELDKLISLMRVWLPKQIGQA